MNNQQHHSKSLIAIALMVKNEAPSIQATLSSLFQEGMRHFFVLDTGSSDNTIELIQAFFTRHQLDGHIKQESFIDFSTSRNRTLELAEQQFPATSFLLMPDAEWHLRNANALINFCTQEQHNKTPLYLIKMKMNTMEFAAARLFRTASQVRFKGVVHEVPEIIATTKAPDSVYFEVKASAQGMEKSNRRWQQDLVLLSQAYTDNPQDPRTGFYLAQTYECINNLNKAYKIYQHRATLNGWDEENFITLLRLGGLAERMDSYSTNWSIALDYYLKAFALRPHRIEPLIKIANHYWPDNIPTCYLFISYAYKISYPKEDLLFIDKEAYEYTRYEIMSRCAWYMGEYVLGEQATQLALKIHPNQEHLLRNLKLYQQQLSTKSPNSKTILTNREKEFL
jgi:glycosyltransferase involved in cell wall biosynthesis